MVEVLAAIACHDRHPDLRKRGLRRVVGRARGGKIFSYIVMSLLALFFLFPLVYMFVSSLKPDAQILQDIAHNGDSEEVLENNLMFSGHNAFRFGSDPFYSNGFIPTVKQLVERITTGR